MSRSCENRGVFFFQHQITIATLFMFRSKNHHGQSNEEQRQQQKLDPAFGRAKKKAGDKIGHEQEIVDELVACGKDNTNTTALIPALAAARLGPGFGGPALILG